uniref:Uncharacterized protein n=1 Tax=Otus sunia TaxID=257818 RepID=A0A8C8A739_9STRI
MSLSLLSKLFPFLSPISNYHHGARPSPPGEDWARDNWTNLQSVTDRVISLQNESICAVLGASLVAAVEDRFKRRSHEKQIIESLENLVQLLRKTISNLEEQLAEKEKVICLLKHQIYPQKELKEPRKYFRENPRVRPLIKAEYAYINDEENDSHITTKEIPYTPTELAKMKRVFGRLPKESEMEYVWRVSLTGGDQIQLSEKEASGYWGHGVFLTTGDGRAPWSLTQRAAYGAGGLNPLDRGDPLAITGTVEQLLESVHKAACLQMIHERKLVPGCESPMMLPVDPEIMTPLTRGLPELLKSTGIDLQRTIASLGPRHEINAYTDSLFNHSSTPSPSNHKKVWTWGEVAQELIDYSRKYGPVKTLEEKSRGICQVGAKDLPLFAGKTGHAWWALGIKKGVPRDIMDGLPTDKLSKLVSKWCSPKQHPRHSQKNKEISPVMPMVPPRGGHGRREK